MATNNRRTLTRNEQESDLTGRMVRKGRQRPSRAVPYARSKAKPENVISKIKSYFLQTIPWFFPPKPKHDDNVVSQDVTQYEDEDRIPPGGTESKYERTTTTTHGPQYSGSVLPSSSLPSTSQSHQKSDVSLPPPTATTSTTITPDDSTGAHVNLRTAADRVAFKQALVQLERGRKFAPEEVEFLMSILQRNASESDLLPQPPQRYPSRYPVIEKSSSFNSSPYPSRNEERKYSFPPYPHPTPFTRSSLWGSNSSLPTSTFNQQISTTTFNHASTIGQQQQSGQYPQMSPLHGSGISSLTASSPMTQMNGIVSTSTLSSLHSTTSPTFGTPRDSTTVHISGVSNGVGGIGEFKIGEFKHQSAREKTGSQSPIKLDFSDISPTYQPPARSYESSNTQASSEVAQQVLRTLRHVGTPLFDAKKSRPLPAPQPRIRVSSPSFDRIESSTTQIVSFASSEFEAGKSDLMETETTTKGQVSSPPLPPTRQPLKSFESKTTTLTTTKSLTQVKPTTTLKPRQPLVPKKPTLTTKPVITKPLTTTKPLVNKSLLNKTAATLTKSPELISSSKPSSRTSSPIFDDTHNQQPLSHEEPSQPTPFSGFNLTNPETANDHSISWSALPGEIGRAETTSLTTSKSSTDSSSGKIMKKRPHSKTNEKPAKKRTLGDSSSTSSIETSEDTTPSFGESSGNGSGMWSFGDTNGSSSFGGESSSAESSGFSFGTSSSGGDDESTKDTSFTVTFDRSSNATKKKKTSGTDTSTDPTFGGFGDPNAGFIFDKSPKQTSTDTEFSNPFKEDGFGSGNGFGSSSVSFGDNNKKSSTTTSAAANKNCVVCGNDLEDMDHTDCQAELKEKDSNNKAVDGVGKSNGSEAVWSFGGSESVTTIPEDSTFGDKTSSTSFDIPVSKPTTTKTLTSKLPPKPVVAGTTKPLLKKQPLVRKSQTVSLKPAASKTVPAVKSKLPVLKEKSDLKALIKAQQEKKKTELATIPESTPIPGSESHDTGVSFGSSEPTFGSKPSTTTKTSPPKPKTCPVCNNDWDDMDHSSCQEEPKDKPKEDFSWGGESSGSSVFSSNFGSATESTDKNDFSFGSSSGGFGSSSDSGFNWGASNDAAPEVSFGGTEKPKSTTSTTTKTSSTEPPTKKDKISSTTTTDPFKSSSSDFSFGGGSTSANDLIPSSGGFGGGSTGFNFGETPSSSTSNDFSFGGGSSETTFGSSTSPKKSSTTATDTSAASKFKVPTFGSNASGGIGNDTNSIFGGFGGNSTNDSSSSSSDYTFGGSSNGTSNNVGFGGFGGGGSSADSGFGGGFGSTSSFGSDNSTSFGTTPSSAGFGDSSFNFGADSGNSSSSFGGGGGGFGGGSGGGGFGSSSNDFGSFGGGGGGGGNGSDDGGGFSMGKRKIVKVKRRGRK